MSNKTVYEDDVEILGTTTTNNLTVTGTLNATANFPSILTSTNTTTSTSNTTGSVVLAGGIGISNTTQATSSTNGGTITTAGGVAIAKNLMVGDTVVIGTNTSAISPLSSTRLYIVGNSTDSPLVSGLGFQRSGSSINSTGINTSNDMIFSLQGSTNFKFQTGQSDYNVAGTIGLTIGTTQISTGITTESSSTSTGSFITSGGVGIAKKLFVGTDLSVGGNITAGTWNASTITVPYGGTGATSLTSNAVLLGNGTGTIQSPSTITFSASTLTLPKIVSNDTTDSSSSTSGAVTIAGGLGVAKRLYVGTNIFTGSNVGIGTSTANAPLQFSSTLANRIIVLNQTANNDHQYHGFGVQSNILRYQVPSTANSHIFYAATSSSTSNELGRILGTGGAQFPTLIGGSTASTNLILRSTSNATKGYVYIDETTDSSSVSTGSLRIAGGVGIAKKLYIGGELNLVNATSNLINFNTIGTAAPTQTTRSTGTKIVLNSAVTASTLDYGIGIEPQNMWFTVPNGATDGFKWYTGNSITNIMRLGSTQLNLPVSTDSSSSTTGAFITAGGVGIAKKLYVGTDLNVGGSVSLTNALTVANGGTGSTSSTGTGSVVLATSPTIQTSLNATDGTRTLSWNTGSLGALSITNPGTNSSIYSSTAGTTGYSSYSSYSNSADSSLFYSGLDGFNFFGLNSGGGLIATNNSNSNKSILLAPGEISMFNVNTTGVEVIGSTASTSSSTGIFKSAGGIGISNTTDATSSTNGGTITTAGGAAIAKKLFVGTDLSVGGSLATPVIGKITPVYARGSSVNNLVNQIVRVGGSTHVNSSNVGLTLTIINASTHALTSATAYDTSTSGTASTNLATALSNLDRQQICILTSYSSFTGSMNAALRASARRLGLYKLSETTTVSTAYCAIFKGQGTANPNTNINNQVIEYLSDASATSDYALLNTWLIDDSISTGILPSVLISPAPDATIVPSVYVNNNSNVGIKNISPVYDLDVNGVSKTTTSIISEGSAFLRFTTDLGITYIQSATTTASDSSADLRFTSYLGDTTNMTLAGTSGNLSTRGTITAGSSTASTSNSTGSFLTTGGLGIQNATDASSSTNGGSITTAGGVAIAKKLYVGGDTFFSGIHTTTRTGGASIHGIVAASGTDAAYNRYQNTNTSETAFVGIDGVGLFNISPGALILTTSSGNTNKNISFLPGSTFTMMTIDPDKVSIFSSITSTSSSSGALLISGGIGLSNSTDASSSTNGGTITTAGGVAIAKKLYVGTDLHVNNTINGNDSSSNTFSWNPSSSGGLTLSRSGANASLYTSVSTSTGYGSFSVYNNSTDGSFFYSGLDGTGFDTQNSGGGLISTSASNSNTSIWISPASSVSLKITESGTDTIGSLYVNSVKVPRFHNGSLSGTSTTSIPIYFNNTQYNYVEIKVRFIVSAVCNITFAGNSAEDGTGTVLSTTEQAETQVKHNDQANPVYTNSSYICSSVEAVGIDNILTFRMIRADGNTSSGLRNHYEFTSVYTLSGTGSTKMTGFGYIANTTLGTNPIRSLKLTCSSGNISGTYSTAHSY